MKLWEASFELRKMYVDLDGVLADFDKGVKDFTGKSPEEWKETEEGESAMWKAVHKVEDFYYHLEKMPDADELWGYVLQYEPHILTAIPRKTSVPGAEGNKRAWVAKHLGPTIPVFIGPYSRDKQRFAKEGYILIDDRPSNIEEWEEKGGTPIHHKNAEDTIKQLKDLGL